MAEFDISSFVLKLLFEKVPRRRRFLLIGEGHVPAPTVDASRIVLGSMGLVMGRHSQGRTMELLRPQVRPGFEVEDSVQARATDAESELASAGSVPDSLKLWALVGIQDQQGSTASYCPEKLIHAFGIGAFFDGASTALVKEDSQDLVRSWLSGINSAWEKAASDSLAIEGHPPDLAAWLGSVDELARLHEAGISASDAKEAAPRAIGLLGDVWQFEVYRLTLFGIGNSSWRDPEKEEYRGILY